MNEFFDFIQQKKTPAQENQNPLKTKLASQKINTQTPSDNLPLSEEESEDENFMRALNKKVFQGKKGHMLLELQKSYKDDKRFDMDKRFTNDIDTNKVPQKLKDLTYAFDNNFNQNENNFSKKIFKEENKKNSIKNQIKNSEKELFDENINIIVENISINNFNEEIFKEKIEQEKLNNLSILSSIVSNQEFLSISKKINDPNTLILKRYDPSLNMGKNLLIENEKKKIENKKNFIKLEKGMEYKSEFNIKEEFADKNNRKEMKKLNDLKKYEKENVLKKIVNEINDEMEPVIDVNYDVWKNITKQKKKKEINSFDLFSDNKNEEILTEKIEDKRFDLFSNDNEENRSKLEMFGLSEDKGKKEEKNTKKNKDKEMISENNKEKENKEKKNKVIEKKKKNKEKDYELMKKKRLRVKEEKHALKVEETKKDATIGKKFQKNLLKTFPKEKVDNYLRYIDMVREKKK